VGVNSGVVMEMRGRCEMKDGDEAVMERMEWRTKERLYIYNLLS
jgi:hypothetical protein